MFKEKKIKALKYIVFTLLFVFAFNKPFEEHFYDLLLENVTNLKYKEGITDIILYKNYPVEDFSQKYIMTLYKGDRNFPLQLKKELSDGDELISNDENLVFHNNNSKNLLQGITKLKHDEMLTVMTDAPTIIEIDNCARDKNELIVLTKYEYANKNIKNILGISLALCFIVYIFVSGFYQKRKIESDSPKKKIIIY